MFLSLNLWVQKLQIRTEPVLEALNDNNKRHNTVNTTNCSGCFDLNCVLCSIVSSCELTWLIKMQSCVWWHKCYGYSIVVGGGKALLFHLTRCMYDTSFHLVAKFPASMFVLLFGPLWCFCAPSKHLKGSMKHQFQFPVDQWNFMLSHARHRHRVQAEN